MFTVLYDVEDVRDMRAWYKQYVEHNMVLDLMVSERNGTQIVPREPSDFQYCAPIYMELGTDYNYYNVEIKWYASIGDYLLKVVCRLPRALQINLVYIEARWRRDFWYELKTPGIATPNVIRYSIAKKHQVHHHLLWWPDGYAWEDIFIEE